MIQKTKFVKYELFYRGILVVFFLNEIMKDYAKYKHLKNT